MRLSPSSLKLAASCLWWARPEVAPPPRVESKWMAGGSEVDAAITAILDGREVDLPALSADARDAYWLWREWFKTWEHFPESGAPQWRPQVRLAYDWRRSTAAEMQRGEHRDYSSVTADEIPMTLDALRVPPDRVLVADWKVGDDWQGITPPVAENPQLAAYAIAAARAFGKERATVFLVRIGSEGVTCESRDFDARDLEDVADELAAIAARIPTATPQPGVHCGRCPAAAVCPEAEREMTALAAPEPIALRIETHEQAAALLTRCKLVTAAVDQIEAAVKVFAETNGGLRTAPGKVWRMTEREQIKLTAEVEGVLHEMGLQGAIEVAAPKTSKAAIERVGKERFGADWKQQSKQLRDRLYQANAIVSVPAGYREVNDK